MASHDQPAAFDDPCPVSPVHTGNVVERCRMALAEVGYPDAEVMDYGDGSLLISWDVPGAVAWRAAILAGGVGRDGKKVACLACCIEADEQSPIFVDESGTIFDSPDPEWECLARGEGIEDCGVDRNPS